jgi:hypothetical protein
LSLFQKGEFTVSIKYFQLQFLKDVCLLPTDFTVCLSAIVAAAAAVQEAAQTTSIRNCK